MTSCGCDGPAPMALAITTTIISAILSFFTISGNLVICIAVYKDPFGTLRTPFMYFLVNLAASDLITGFITMPSSVVVHIIELFIPSEDQIHILMHFMRVTYFISATAILLSLILLSVDRYLAVAKPFAYRRHTGPKRRVFATICIWLISISLPVIYFVTNYITLLMIFANTCVAVALCILAFSYFRVYKSLTMQCKKMEGSQSIRCTSSSNDLETSSKLLRQKDERVTRAFLIILAVFALCYVPVIVVIYLLKFYPNCDCTVRHTLRDLQFILGLTFSAAIPFVCALQHRPFRRAAFKILGVRSRCSYGTNNGTRPLNKCHAFPPEQGNDYLSHSPLPVSAVQH